MCFSYAKQIYKFILQGYFAQIYIQEVLKGLRKEELKFKLRLKKLQVCQLILFLMILRMLATKQ